MQVLNKFFKGKIVLSQNNDHVKKDHEIFISDKKISDFLNQDQIIVNSFHKNIIKFKDVGESLNPFAIHKNDDTVEGFTHKELPITGVMWHPERDQNVTLVKKLILNKILG